MGVLRGTVVRSDKREGTGGRRCGMERFFRENQEKKFGGPFNREDCAHGRANVTR